ncbi:FAD-binding dehydrogenase [Microbacterium sp. LRZ72]|uniref:FAD-binding dehydrogenase n=1 Tax=Microbacterium sp. LRZ72 TaxID=2942481 RepID=UPI0029BF8E5E|nr:FAD-binding dehydrogenase [Microbacterium sp. LRZ72]MDX2377550.1 FAD-binding dehydrogenase [Microbacterium sp. LRZ72]
MSKRDVIVIGSGLSGLVTAAELVRAGKRVLIVDQEPAATFGGQAFWSLGGLFIVDTPEQRALGIHDSLELARNDWMSTARFDRAEDEYGEQWANSYVKFAAVEMRDWLADYGIELAPIIGWPEARREGIDMGNSVPRCHIVWGMGPGLLEPFQRKVIEGQEAGLVDLRFRHRVDELLRDESGAVVGVAGSILSDDDAPRGARTSREVIGTFSEHAPVVVIAAGGVGGNLEMVRRRWPTDRVGPAPATLLRGVPEHVDGRMVEIAEGAGAHLINLDRMWTYAEGLRHHTPQWDSQGVRILPGPSAVWLDGRGDRLPESIKPGSDALGGLIATRANGQDTSWFVVSRIIAETELTLAGQDQNPHLRAKTAAVPERVGIPAAIQAFMDHGEDFVVADNLDDLVTSMAELSADVEPDRVRNAILEHDREVEAGITAITGREGGGDAQGSFIRVAAAHAFLDPSAGPLIAIRLRTITRKSLGGLETDLRGRVLTVGGSEIDGLYAVGEAAGFGGGGVHGYSALEGTFLGGCLFTGRQTAAALIETLAENYT